MSARVGIPTNPRSVLRVYGKLEVLFPHALEWKGSGAYCEQVPQYDGDMRNDGYFVVRDRNALVEASQGAAHILCKQLGLLMPIRNGSAALVSRSRRASATGSGAAPTSD